MNYKYFLGMLLCASSFTRCATVQQLQDQFNALQQEYNRLDNQLQPILALLAPFTPQIDKLPKKLHDPGNDRIQLAVANQGPNALCGYNALKNALAIGDALNSKTQGEWNTAVARLQELPPQKWMDAIVTRRKLREKAPDGGNWADEEELFDVFKGPAGGRPYPVTVVDDLGRLLAPEGAGGIPEQKIEGLTKAKAAMEKKPGIKQQDYLHAFAIGNMNEYDGKFGHWFTAVLRIKDEKTTWILADSAGNANKTNSVPLNRLITALDTVDFSTIQATAETVDTNKGIIEAAEKAFRKKKYYLADNRKRTGPEPVPEADAPIMNRENPVDFINAAIKAAEIIIEKAKEVGVWKANGFEKMRTLIANMVTNIRSAVRQKITICSDADPQKAVCEEIKLPLLNQNQRAQTDRILHEIRQTRALKVRFVEV